MSTTEQILTRDIRLWLENHREIASEYTVRTKPQALGVGTP